MSTNPTSNAASKSAAAENNRLQLSKITKQGQYVNPKTGHLLIVDSKIETALKNGPELFNCFIAKNQGDLEFMRVSENPQLPIEDARVAVGKLNLPVNF